MALPFARSILAAQPEVLFLRGAEIGSLTLFNFLSATAEQYPNDLLVFFIANHNFGDYIGKSKANGSIDDFYQVNILFYIRKNII
jgi:hypothetical protein